MSERLNQYIDDIMRFKPDLYLEPVSLVKHGEQPMRMAAAGDEAPQLELERVGRLESPDGRILARVFLDYSQQHFRLYLLSQALDTAYAVLISEENTHHFVADRSGLITLPTSIGIMPNDQRLGIALPVDYAEINIKDPENFTSPYSTPILGLSISDYDDVTGHLEFTNSESAGERVHQIVLSGEEDDEQPFLRMLPFQDGRVRIHLPENCGASFTVCLYR